MTKHRVAIIEDDSAISGMYELKLGLCGYDVKVAHNGELGLKLIESFKPEVILLDLMMPIMNGLEALQVLKDKPDFTNAKIMVLSNMGDSNTAEKIRGFKVDDRIIKADFTPA